MNTKKIKRLKESAPKRIINNIGCLAAKWILHNCDDGLIIKRKGGARQIIKVFAEPAYRNVIKPAIHKATEVIKVGDVVTDDDYHGEAVVAGIYGNKFCGYYLADGLVISGLDIDDFKKIASHADVKIEHPSDPRQYRL